MSFSGMVKEELYRRQDTARHCQLAELCALLIFSAVMRPDRENRTPKIVFRSENELILRKCFTLLEKTFNIVANIAIDENSPAPRGHVFSAEISDESCIGRILQGTKVVSDGDTGELILDGNSLITQRECCRRAFLRGAFLSSGSMSDPNKGYHFEIVCSSETKAKQLKAVICSFSIDAKIVQRKHSYVVYVKEGAQIVDMLGLMGASVALMDLENIRIVKEMRNSVNRQVNCETANINKTVNAAVRQMEDIRLIQDIMGFQGLSGPLQEIAVVRLQHPEATLKELGLMLNPQVGKSGVNHRLRKLSEIAGHLRENEEDLL
ncbi:MAG: DNA-binding protein WhiA [Blautia sp.]|nr:DNA-binding protein WhiA [Blautia sp.]